MKIFPVTSSFAVAQQVHEYDLQNILSQGYKSLINNRPDKEAEDQPTSISIQAAASQHALEYRYIPIAQGCPISDEDIKCFSQALQELPGPVLAFCLSGKRSITLWILDQAQHTNPSTLLHQASQLGYNLQALKPRLQIFAHSVLYPIFAKFQASLFTRTRNPS